MDAGKNVEVWPVVVSRNRHEELAEQVARLGRQVQGEERVVVVLDGDPTAELELGADGQVIVFRELEHIGVNRARRIGTAMVPTDAVVCELDDHDWVEPDLLAELRKAFKDGAVMLAYCDVRQTDPQRMMTKGLAKRQYHQGGFAEGGLHLGMKAYRKWIYDAVGGWPLDVFPAGDMMLMVKMEQLLRGRGVAYIQKPLVTVVRSRADSISGEMAKAQNDRAAEIKATLAQGGFNLPFALHAPVPGKAIGKEVAIGGAPVEIAAPKGRPQLVFSVNQWGPGYGGGELTTKAVAESLDEAGFDVHLTVSGKLHGECPDQKVTIAESVDVIGKHTAVVLCQSVPAPDVIERCMRFGVPYILYLQFWRRLYDMSAPELWDRLNARDFKQLLLPDGAAAVRRADALVGNSQFTSGCLRTITGRAVGACRPYVGADAVAKVREPRHALMPSAQDAKGLRMFARLAEDNPQMEFVALCPDDAWGKQESAARFDGLPNTVHRGWVTDMASMYGEARVVFVGTETCETFGRCAAEAMANGIPVLASASGNMQNLPPDKAVIVKLPLNYEEVAAGFASCLAMEARPSPAPPDQRDVLVREAQNLTSGRRIGVVYPVGGRGVANGVRHLCAVTGATPIPSERLGDVERSDFDMVILSGGYDEALGRFLKRWKRPAAFNWRSDTTQMALDSQELEQFRGALDWMQERDDLLMFMSSRRDAEGFADMYGPRFRWLPDCYEWRAVPHFRGRPGHAGRFAIPIIGPAKPRKGAPILVCAAAMAGADLVLSESAMTEPLRSLMTALGVTWSTVEPATQDQMLNVLHSECNAAAFPNLGETFCYAALECMLAELAVVGSPLVPVTKYRDKELTEALTVEKPMAGTLATILTRLKADPDLADALGKKCRQHALQIIQEQNEAAQKALAEIRG